MVMAVVEKEAPQRQKMSYEEYLAFASDGQIAEWVDGEVIIYMPPLYDHQNLVSLLDALLRSFVQFFSLGVIVPAPFEVKLWPGGPSREPDIIFISNNHLPRLTSKRFEGGPDLIVEVISPGSVTEDRVRKFTEYEQAGVGEYWIIDPRPYQRQVDFYVLGEDSTYYPAPIGEDGIYHSTALPHFWLNIEWLWQENLPNPQLALAEIMISIPDLPAEAKQAYEALYRLLVNRH
jgi:Uma2 family endonuclease